jgi:hypothetical protein
MPNPTDVGQAERILTHPGVFRDAQCRVTGTCTIGLRFTPLPCVCAEEKYLLWYDAQCSRSSGRDDSGHIVLGPGGLGRPGGPGWPVYLHIILKDGYIVNDQLKAWIHAVGLFSMIAHAG